METRILLPGQPVLKAEAVATAHCEALRSDALDWQRGTPCSARAGYLVDGVAVCGAHRRQVEMCKRSGGTSLPEWFVTAATLAPHGHDALIPEKRSLLRRLSRRRRTHFVVATKEAA